MKFFAVIRNKHILSIDAPNEDAAQSIIDVNYPLYGAGAKIFKHSSVGVMINNFPKAATISHSELQRLEWAFEIEHHTSEITKRKKRIDELYAMLSGGSQ